MSLATRCPSCGTIFRVVQDQLKVSEGWVRCGRCGEVFNALQALFDLERESPPPFLGTQSPPLPAGPEPAARDSATATPPVPSSLAAGRTAEPAATAPPATAEAPPASRPLPQDESPMPSSAGAEAAAKAPIAVDAAAEVPAPADSWSGPSDRGVDDRGESEFDATRQDAALTRVDEPIDGDAYAAHAPAPLPAFLRDDERGQRSASPLVRASAAFGAVALALLLVAQVAVHHRERVVQQWPWSRPVLAQWCSVAGCELLEAPRRIESFSVESSSLTRAAANGDAYRLSVTLRNRGPQPALMPSIDIVLNDGDGRLLARRALHPSDFRVQRAVVGPGAETTLQLVMTAAKGPVNGYTLEIFYP